MTDEVSTTTQQSAAALKREPSSGGNRSNGRGRRGSGMSRSISAQGGKDMTRPSSQNSNRSGQVTGAKRSDSIQKSTSTGEPTRGHGTRGSKSGGRGGKRVNSNNGGRQQGPNVSSTSPNSTKAGQVEENPGDALVNLQRMISDLKSMTPGNPELTGNNQQPQLGSNINAPVFEPGAASYPGLGAPDIKHKKAASLGVMNAPQMGFSNSYSPHLGSMSEDAEAFEEGEIHDPSAFQLGHQPRSQSQNFTAPRFAALARQEQAQSQAEILGPSGRPQLAPTFTFGARRRGGTNPPSLGPPISEEDANFQFPQQHQQQQETLVPPPQEHRRTASSGGEITGIMAEQVLLFDSFLSHTF